MVKINKLRAYPATFNRKTTIRRAFLTFYFLLSILLFVTACQPNASILNSKTDAPPPISSNSAPAKSSVETDVETMRTADFDFIYVFRRKDGAVLTAEDKKYVKDNSPPETNRFLLSDEEKAVVAGSKYIFSPEHLKALSTRFAVENFSKPGSEANVNANSAANANLKNK